MIKRFNEYVKIYELYVNKDLNLDSEELNDKYIILYRKDLWIFDEDEWNTEEFYNSINTAYGEDILNEDLYDSLCIIREKYLDIITGQISDNTIYIDSNDGFRHSEHSDDLYKLKKELDMPIVVRYYTGKYLDKEEESIIDIKKKKLQHRTFYHGTCLKFLPNIIKSGIKQTHHTNFKDITHTDKIFFTLNIDKAQFYAFNSASINKSFPIIIEFNIPDVNKLVVDYDLARSIYGDKSKELSNNYIDFKKGFIQKGIGYKKDITNKIGVYGYNGRIPSSYIQNISIDLVAYRDNQYLFNPNYGEMYMDDDDLSSYIDSIENWSIINKNKIMDILDDIHKDYESEFDDE